MSSRWIHTAPILAVTPERTYSGPRLKSFAAIPERRQATVDKAGIHPPLRTRLRRRGQRPDGLEAPSSRAAMARTGSLLAAAGALLLLLSTLLPGGGSLDDGVLVAVSAASAAGAVLLIAVYDRMPLWGFHALALAATALVSVAVYGWGSGSAYAPLPYAWIALFVFYFFGWRAALAHMAALAAGYAAALAAESPAEAPVAGWVATVATLLVAGALAALVRDRVGRLIASFADVAQRDPLTGLLDRRGFVQVFDMELERARRSDTPLSLVVGDLDDFKRLSDDLGQAGGDEALRTTARALRGAKRGFDSAARVGGEEFALLAPNCDEHGAYLLAERVRAEIEGSLAGGRRPLTASFGVATFPLHGQSAEALLLAGDQALYAAKRLGRNRSVISSAEVRGILASAPRGHQDGHVELAVLLNLAEALDLRESGSASHCRRVGRLAELTARELGLPPDSVERVRLAGILHDVGRVAVPDGLLAKPGPLTDGERDWLRAHPETGARMLETTDFDDLRHWILLHHERPDGKGYPERRAWEDVPLEARILGVADAYEAMTAERPYRAALPPEQAAEELRRESGRQFDRDVVEALLRVL